MMSQAAGGYGGYGTENVVIEQPAPLAAEPPPVYSVIPPGLQPLANTAQVCIKQEVELFEVLSGREFANHYSISNEQGQTMFHAMENSNWLLRQCCGANRAFDITVIDTLGNEVLDFYRPFRCWGSCITPCCLQQMDVTQDGLLLGSMKENIGPSQSFSIRSPTGETQLKIRRGCCACATCCSEVNFKIKSADGRYNVGLLTKQYRGMIAEAFTDADTFTVQFPRDMNVATKATVLGAVFLIDYMYFEDKAPK